MTLPGPAAFVDVVEAVPGSAADDCISRDRAVATVKARVKAGCTSASGRLPGPGVEPPVVNFRQRFRCFCVEGGFGVRIGGNRLGVGVRGTGRESGVGGGLEFILSREGLGVGVRGTCH